MSSRLMSQDKLRILEFFIFHRNGTCLFHLDMQDKENERDKNIKNKALAPSTNKEAEHRYKLLYGMLFSMKSFVKTLSPKDKSEEKLKSLSTSKYTLHYAEYMNGLRFILMTSKTELSFIDKLNIIHKRYYTNLISKNIFVNLEDQIKNDHFLDEVYKYLDEYNRGEGNAR